MPVARYVVRRCEMECICGKCVEEGHFFVCARCGRDTPWCRGADDEYPELCDDCAVLAQQEVNNASETESS